MVNINSPSVVRASNETHLNRSIWPLDIRLFKSTNYPPHTAEEKALWEWWHAMDKNDPHFRWKMPIEFYGKVVDQFGEPVAHATVNFVWTTVVGPIPDPKKEILSGIDGRFSLKGVKGKRICVDIAKIDYLSTDNSLGSFEYADFYDENFHIPDKNNPVVFQLYKLLGSEPLYQYDVNKDLVSGGSPIALDVINGKIESVGDVYFSVQLGKGQNKKGRDYTLSIQAGEGAGFALSSERFPFLAPESGYQTKMTISQSVTNKNYDQMQKYHFYVMTRSGKYGVVWFETLVPRIGNKINFNATIRYNPSGSRNLEFDHRQWINR